MTMAPVAMRRWSSFGRRGLHEGDFGARVRDLVKGLIAHFEPEPRLVGPLRRDYECVAERIASVLAQARSAARESRHEGDDEA